MAVSTAFKKLVAVTSVLVTSSEISAPTPCCFPKETFRFPGRSAGKLIPESDDGMEVCFGDSLVELPCEFGGVSKGGKCGVSFVADAWGVDLAFCERGEEPGGAKSDCSA